MTDHVTIQTGRPVVAADGGTSNDSPGRDDGDHGPDRHHDHVDRDHHDHHGHHSSDLDTLGVAVVTVSSTRSLDDDRSGDIIVEAVESADHTVVTRELVSDDYDTVQRTVDTFTARKDVDVVITTGGTGVTPDDVTVEAVAPLFEKELPGFGELFRRLSYDEIGTRVVGTRAVAGVADGVVVFCLPGSSNAVRLGTESIILEVATHLAGLAGPGPNGDGDEG